MDFEGNIQSEISQMKKDKHCYNINILGRDVTLSPNISLGMSLMYCSLLGVHTIQEARGEMTGEVTRTLACVCVCICECVLYIYVERRSDTMEKCVCRRNWKGMLERRK